MPKNYNSSGIILYVDSSLNPTRKALPPQAQPTSGLEAPPCELHLPYSTLPILVTYKSPVALEADQGNLFEAPE